MNLDPVLMSRLLTMMTLGFHIIFATLGVGVPLMISIAEFIGIKKKDPHYLLMAKRWARGFVITVAVGVVTGTAIGLQLSLLWPSFMQVAGNVISLPLFMEVFAFFFEAIFLGIYLYTWDRFKNPYIHWSFSLPVIIGGGMSAVFITTVNAFMNTPEGFSIGDSGFASINPLQAMLNPATPTKVFHVVVTAYVTVAAILLTIAAFSLLKNKASTYHKKALKFTLTLTFIFALLSAVAGDFSAKFLAEHQPEKLAAAEWHFETEENADLVLLGWLNKDGEPTGEMRIPGLLSFLAHNDFSGEVTGLYETPENERPPLWIHYMFDFMVIIGMFLAAVPVLYFIISKMTKWNVQNKWMLRLLVLMGPLAVAAIEFGWILAEEGRQPWILRGFMKVEDAATTSSHVGLMFIFFFLLYATLGTLCVVILRRMFRNKPAMEELWETYPETKKEDDQ